MKYTITQIKGGTDNCYIISNGADAILFDTASGENLQHVKDDNIFDDYNSQPLKSYGIVGFVVLKLSLKVLAKTKVARPENRLFVKEGDTLKDYGFPDIKVVELPGHSMGSIGLLVSDDVILVGDALDNWIKPGMGHLYTDIEALKMTTEKIRSYGKRTYYYGHGKPTEKF